MQKKFTALCVLCLSLFFLSGCGNELALDLSGIHTNPERFVWPSMADLDVSLGDVGLFYSKDSLLRYYDMGTQQSYVLCSRANCMHNSTNCPAYFPSAKLFLTSVDNVAQIDSYIYCTFISESDNAIQLLRIDASTGNRKIVASFPCLYKATADSSEDDYYATNIGSVQYINGYAWFALNMHQHGAQGISYDKLWGVNLETGKLIALNQEYSDYTYSFESICAHTIYYCRTRRVVKELSIDEFYEQSSDTKEITIDGHAFSDYSAYWTWHMREFPSEYAVFAYNVDTGETREVYSGTTVKSEYGQAKTNLPLGEYNGNSVWYEINTEHPDSEGQYSLSNLQLYTLDANGNRQPLLTIENGNPCYIAQGYTCNKIFPDGTLLYYEENEEAQTSDLYAYDFTTGKSTFLFTDDPAITFRIYGEYNGGFFGKHKDHQDDMRFYWISRKDYYAGNLDAAVMYQL